MLVSLHMLSKPLLVPQEGTTTFRASVMTKFGKRFRLQTKQEIWSRCQHLVQWNTPMVLLEAMLTLSWELINSLMELSSSRPQILMVSMFTMVTGVTMTADGLRSSEKKSTTKLIATVSSSNHFLNSGLTGQECGSPRTFKAGNTATGFN